jgi:phosphoribosylformylglycinamidine (FGAM) synthase-like enzyme
VQQVVREAIGHGLVSAAHDCSEGGLLITLAESCIGGKVGGHFDLTALRQANGRLDRALFGEAGSRVVLQARESGDAALERMLVSAGAPFLRLGETGGELFEIEGLCSVPLEEMTRIWSQGLR